MRVPAADQTFGRAARAATLARQTAAARDDAHSAYVRAARAGDLAGARDAYRRFLRLRRDCRTLTAARDLAFDAYEATMTARGARDE